MRIFVFLLFLASTAFAQHTSEIPQKGLRLYEDGNFEAALTAFQEFDTPTAKLFAGKSLFALGRYTESIDVLIPVLAEEKTGQEAAYTLSLSFFQLREYTHALETLFELLEQKTLPADLKVDAKKLYSDIIDFLSDRERLHVSRTARYKTIRSDVTGYAKLKASIPGFSASIGIAVPLVDKDDELFEVSQGLYNGFALAIEKFNEENRDYKIFLRHMDANSDSLRPADQLRRALQQGPLDAVVGPLYSHHASEMAKVAEEFEIPLLAPLANSDTLSILNPYVFQLNPVYGSRGRAMAQFAVKKMQLDSVTIIAEKGSLGEAEALAFAEEAQRLGATINYFFLKDLEKLNYDITPFLQALTTDKKLLDSLHYVPSKAIYLPFTGEAAQALIENATADLAFFNPKTVILGSEEWGTATISEETRGKMSIYYSAGFQEADQTKTTQLFRQAYKDRFGGQAKHWAFVGYDAGQFISQSLLQVRNPKKMRRFWLDRGLHEGLVARINFIRSNVNKGVRVYKLDKTKKIEIR